MGGRVLLITGGSSGIGAATARRAVASGFRVALIARSEAHLRSLAAEIGDDNSVLPLGCDVTSHDDLDRAAARTVETFGRIDAVFANAGVPGRRGFEAGDVDLWHRMVLTNVLGTALTVRATLPALKRSRGHYLLMGSIAGREVLAGSLYSCTKSAVATLADSLRMEVEGAGIRVTLLEPGVVATPQFRERPASSLDPDDVADVVLYALEQGSRVEVNILTFRASRVPDGGMAAETP